MGAGEGRPPFKRPPADALRKPPPVAAPKCGRTPQASSSSAAAPRKPPLQVRPHSASPLFKCGRTRDIFHVSAGNMWGNLRECPFGGRDLTALASALAASALAGSALAGSAPAGTRRKSTLADSRRKSAQRKRAAGTPPQRASTSREERRVAYRVCAGRVVGTNYNRETTMGGNPLCLRSLPTRRAR